MYNIFKTASTILILLLVASCDGTDNKAENIEIKNLNEIAALKVKAKKQQVTPSYNTIDEIFLNIHIGSTDSILSKYFYQKNQNEYTKLIDNFDVLIKTKNGLVDELKIERKFDLEENSFYLDKFKELRQTFFYDQYKHG